MQIGAWAGLKKRRKRSSDKGLCFHTKVYSGGFPTDKPNRIVQAIQAVAPCCQPQSPPVVSHWGQKKAVRLTAPLIPENFRTQLS